MFVPNKYTSNETVFHENQGGKRKTQLFFARRDSLKSLEAAAAPRYKIDIFMFRRLWSTVGYIIVSFIDVEIANEYCTRYIIIFYLSCACNIILIVIIVYTHTCFSLSGVTIRPAIAARRHVPRRLKIKSHSTTAI